MISKHETDFWSPYELQANAVSPHGEAHVAETLPAAVASLSMFLGHVLEYHFFISCTAPHLNLCCFSQQLSPHSYWPTSFVVHLWDFYVLLVLTPASARKGSFCEISIIILIK